MGIIITFLLFQNTGKLESAKTINKHEQIVTYFEEVYHQYLHTSNILSNLIKNNQLEIWNTSAKEIHDLYEEIDKTIQAFDTAKIPNHFILYYETLEGSLAAIDEIAQTIEQSTLNDTYDYEQLNILIQSNNELKEVAKGQLEQSFSKAKMDYTELEDGSFRFMHYSDKSVGR